MINEWQLEKTGNVPKILNPLLIEGLPGIGNVGKVAVDFIVEELEAKKIFNVISYSMPNSVFVNEDNLVELPTLSVYHKKIASGKDILFVSGDAQPIDEESSYKFSGAMLDMLAKYNGKEVITLGGIGLPAIPKKPKVYCTGSSTQAVKKLAGDTSANPKLYGVVGPIIGVSGLLIGLAKRRKLLGVSFLAETYGHPMYLGIRGAREIVTILNAKFSLGIDIKELDEEIKELEAEADKPQVINLQKSARGLVKPGKSGEANYIG